MCSKSSYAYYPRGKSQDLYTIHAIETNATIFKQQKTVYEITTCVQYINNIDCPRQPKGCLVKWSELHDRNFRDSSLIDGMRAKSTMGQCSFKSAAARKWNSLPRNIRDTPTLRTFKSKLFNYFQNLGADLHVCSILQSQYLVSRCDPVYIFCTYLNICHSFFCLSFLFFFYSL